MVISDNNNSTYLRQRCGTGCKCLSRRNVFAVCWLYDIFATEIHTLHHHQHWMSVGDVVRQQQRLTSQLEDELRRHCIDVDAFATSTACCDLAL